MPNDTYKSGSDNSRATQYQYNPKTGAWEPVSSGSSANSNSGSNSSPLSTTTENGGTVTVDSSSKVNSQAEADKEYIEVEFNTLEGDLTLKASAKTIKIKSGQTIKIEGLGKYLSGLYYVSAVKRTIDSSAGYSHTFTVIKTGFGSSLKKVTVDVKEKETRKEKVEPKPTTFKVGDKVKFLTVEAKKYTYSNAHEGTYVPKWVTEKTHTVDGVSDDGKRVRLKEIWSWTYVKFLKKA